MQVKQARVSLNSMLKYEARQFCLNTALHGYKFIVLPKRTLLERVFWGIVVVISLISAVTLMCIAWLTFQENPTILVTDSTHYPIWNYPFPAVTICLFNKMRKSKTYELAEKLSESYDIDKDFLAQELRLLVQAFFNDNDLIPARNFTKLQDILDSNDYTVERALQEIAPNCTVMLQRCKWKGEEKRCESIFEQIVTTEGYCCSFNYYALKNHEFQGVLANKIPKMPRRVSACGFLTALEVLVNSYPEEYWATPITSIGHYVILHNPFHFPDWTHQTILTPRRILSMIGVTPSITYAADNIKDIDVGKRKCLFINESYLHNFKQYSFHNCMVECRMNLSLKYCGCVPFYYWNSGGTFPKTKICTLRDISCLTEYRHLIISSLPGQDFSQIQTTDPEGFSGNICGCLPDCEYVDYVAEYSSGVFTREYATNQLNLYGGVVIKHQSVIRVFFNDLVANRNRRGVIFSWHTLLAYYGGLLGLFIGFSFVSAVEFVYFFTVRLLIDMKTKNEEIGRARKNENKFRVRQRNFQPRNPNRLRVPVEGVLNVVRRRSNSNSDK